MARRNTISLSDLQGMGAKRKERDGPTPEQHAAGEYKDRYVTHVESFTRSKAFVNRSNIVDRWFDERWPGFEQGARLAIDWCHKAWEARGEIGNTTANYEPTVGGGVMTQFARDVELVDDLMRLSQLFHPTHWAVFENVCRWGMPAGVAGSDLATNTPQSIASARATVGLVANFIAMQRGY